MMLQSHLKAVEEHLLKISEVPANSGHSLHKGTPRETFIREFLQKHLTELIGFGTGEIIDRNSQPREQRNQIDIVLYKKNYPKLDFGGGINAFLAEAVAATVEVKSMLTAEELTKALNSIRKTKALIREEAGIALASGYRPPGIVSYIVAYNGPASMRTIYGWLKQYELENRINYPTWGTSVWERTRFSSPLVDLIIVLGKGIIHFDNGPITFPSDEDRKRLPDARWIVRDNANHNLLILFSHLTGVLSGVAFNVVNMSPYLQGIEFGEMHFMS